MTGAAAGGAARPYYRSPSGDVVLWRGDATAVLRALPAGSVRTCITSVPYYALRSYNTEPQVWGGDASCAHEWGETLRTHWANSVPGPNGLGGKNAAGRNEEKYHGGFCGRCGAWRGELGLEPTPDLYVEHIVAVFREVRRVLHPSGCLWLNCGDSYAGVGRGPSTSSTGERGLHTSALQGGALGGAWDTWRPPPAGTKAKDLLMIPSRVAIALRDDGWWLRAMIPWLKRNAMPESADDRPTTATEYVFLLSKAANYYYDSDAVRVAQADFARGANGQRVTLTDERPEPGVRNRTLNEIDRGGNRRAYHPGGRNRRNADWWFDSLRAILAGATGLLADEDGEPLALPVNPAAYDKAHFATFPPKLVEPMLLASTSARGACPACLAPWVRVTETSYVPHGDSAKSQHKTTFGERASGDFEKGRLRPQEMPHGRATRVDTTTGWRAGCACADAGDPIPCTVLDPFCGSGTVSLVARKHGRTSWGIDLSAAYLDLARERLGQLAFDMGGAAWPTTSTSTDTPTGSASSATGDSPSPDGDGAASGSSTRPDGEARQAALDFDLAAGG